MFLDGRAPLGCNLQCETCFSVCVPTCTHLEHSILDALRVRYPRIACNVLLWCDPRVVWCLPGWVQITGSRRQIFIDQLASGTSPISGFCFWVSACTCMCLSAVLACVVACRVSLGTLGVKVHVLRFLLEMCVCIPNRLNFQLNCSNDWCGVDFRISTCFSFRITSRVSLHTTFLNLWFVLIFVQSPSNLLSSFLMSSVGWCVVFQYCLSTLSILRIVVCWRSL